MEELTSFNFLFFVYLMTLSIAWIIQHQIIGLLVNKELENMYKEAIVV
jgi:hypothetical protein